VKLTKTLGLPIAGLLAIGAAGAVFAATGGNPAGAGTPVVPAADAATPAPSASWPPQKGAADRDTLLSDVLDQLVTKGTITGSQKTAILDALSAERTARQQAAQRERQQLKDFLSDGVITQDELNQLPADSPIRKLTTLLDDGKITIDELRSLGRGFVGGRGGFGGHGPGFGGRGPAASPAPSTGPSS
jgi:polyhydroxyalkanoate synthesis regulator phasin